MLLRFPQPAFLTAAFAVRVCKAAHLLKLPCALQLSLLKYGMEMFQGDPCRIARIVASKPCAEVCARMRALEPSLPLAMPGDPALGARKPSPAKRKLNAPTRRNNATKVNVSDDGYYCKLLQSHCSTAQLTPASLGGGGGQEHDALETALQMWWTSVTKLPCIAVQVVQKRHKHDSGKPWPAYNPCSCVGGCDNSCPCLVSKNFCEKFCGCSATCSIRFVGCQCTSGCRSKLCPCFAAGVKHYVIAIHSAAPSCTSVASLPQTSLSYIGLNEATFLLCRRPPSMMQGLQHC